MCYDAYRVFGGAACGHGCQPPIRKQSGAMAQRHRGVGPGRACGNGPIVYGHIQIAQRSEQLRRTIGLNSRAAIVPARSVLSAPFVWKQTCLAEELHALCTTARISCVFSDRTWKNKTALSLMVWLNWTVRPVQRTLYIRTTN